MIGTAENANRFKPISTSLWSLIRLGERHLPTSRCIMQAYGRLTDAAGSLTSLAPHLERWQSG